MRSAIINKTPEQWLQELGHTPEKISEVINSFTKGAALRVYMYAAPHLFLRFHGKKAKNAIYLPNYWVDGTAIGSAFGRASQFEGMLTGAEISRVAKNYYREITAICRNWNDLRDNELWKIELRGSETVEGVEGPIAPQPTFAPTRTEPASASMLSGGATQVYLNPRTPFICTPVDWNVG
ncbi:hypothetical protein [Belnapia moabensis]|uniref:hypothetical protein n=1 Tax=Belnapia moabensis TaxID=365533 RepID=UPI0005B80D24|nr:hypothetical protein [Belnapia moabensis]